MRWSFISNIADIIWIDAVRLAAIFIVPIFDEAALFGVFSLRGCLLHVLVKGIQPNHKRPPPLCEAIVEP
jgi:hypothetical protein